MNIFKKIGSWIWGGIRKIVSSEDAAKKLKNIAIPIVESITHIDWNKDGKISAANEIWAAVEATGKDWGKSFLELGKEDTIKAISTTMPKEDLKRWLATARMAQSIASQYGLDHALMEAVNKNKLVDGVILDIILEKAKDVIKGIEQ
jgi:hypothetical protein